MLEVRYEDLPIVFQSDGAATDEIDYEVWLYIWISQMIERNSFYVSRS